VTPGAEDMSVTDDYLPVGRRLVECPVEPFHHLGVVVDVIAMCLGIDNHEMNAMIANTFDDVIPQVRQVPAGFVFRQFHLVPLFTLQRASMQRYVIVACDRRGSIYSCGYSVGGRFVCLLPNDISALIIRLLVARIGEKTDEMR